MEELTSESRGKAIRRFISTHPDELDHFMSWRLHEDLDPLCDAVR